MKPKPFWVLKNFTVPTGITIPPAYTRSCFEAKVYIVYFSNSNYRAPVHYPFKTPACPAWYRKHVVIETAGASWPPSAARQSSQVKGTRLASGRHRRLFCHVDRRGMFHLRGNTVAVELPTIVISTFDDADREGCLVVHKTSMSFPRPKHQFFENRLSLGSHNRRALPLLGVEHRHMQNWKAALDGKTRFFGGLAGQVRGLGLAVDLQAIPAFLGRL